MKVLILLRGRGVFGVNPDREQDAEHGAAAYRPGLVSQVALGACGREDFNAGWVRWTLGPKLVATPSSHSIFCVKQRLSSSSSCSVGTSVPSGKVSASAPLPRPSQVERMSVVDL